MVACKSSLHLFYIIPRIGISKDTKLYIMDPSPVSPKVEGTEKVPIFKD